MVKTKEQQYEILAMTKIQLSKIYGKTGQAIDQWREHGMPMMDEVGPNNTHLFWLPDVVAWRERFIRGSDVLSAQAEKGRLDKYRANKAELEYNLMLGNLVETDEVTKAVAGYITDCVSRLMSLPNKLAPIVFGAKTIPKAEALIRGELYDAVSELRDLKPNDYIERDNKVMETATNIESKRMGRQTSKVKPRGKRRTGKVADK